MTVYAEILFIENFITGAVILILTGKIRGIRAAKWRIAIGAGMCGIYAFILFVPLRWMAALVSKMLFSAAVVLAVFGRSTWRGMLKTAGVFYIISFLMGGVTVALMYMMKIPGMTGNGSFMLKGTTFLQIAVGIIVTWYLGNWLAEMLREKIRRKTVITEVTIHIGDNVWDMKAFVDTGNSLRDPVTGYPVAVLSRFMGDQIKTAVPDCRSCVIPYKTIGGKGIMYGIRPDRITAGDELIEKVVLGIGKSDFSPWQGTEKYDLLLHRQLLEGED